MPFDAKLESFIHRHLSAVDDNGTRGLRLLDDARRLWSRAQRLLAIPLLQGDVDYDAIYLACYALQLPLRHAKHNASHTRTGQLSLRDRSEQAAELIISLLADRADASLVERCAKILRELPQRNPASSESKLLADAFNLDDFGLTGLVLCAMHLARQHSSVTQLIESYGKRKEYGYWDARLKDGFHFPQVREIALARLKSVDRALHLLTSEISDDTLPTSAAAREV